MKIFWANSKKQKGIFQKIFEKFLDKYQKKKGIFQMLFEQIPQKTVFFKNLCKSHQRTFFFNSKNKNVHFFPNEKFT